ncbi:hypothetical protein [Marinobacter sp. OP 3.4]|uniref:hypothetical protein n=1 Tax=Marinobacter sp. OP 3.4 TaxID=3076501 RepID=UPI002E216B4F
MQDTLKILETVNQFYSQSFNQLVIITVAVLTFAGVIMPILISLYQKRLFRLEHQEIKEKIKEELNEDMQDAVTRIREEYEEKEKEHHDKIKYIENKLEKEVSGALGASLHLQASMNIRDGSYLAAFYSLTRAATNHIKSEKEVNLRRALKLINNKCLPELDRNTLEHDEYIIESFEDLVKSLAEFNSNQRYDDDIRFLKIRFKNAMEREHNDEA